MGGRREKLIKDMYNNPNNVRFESLASLLRYYGFLMHQSGGGSSHYVFKHSALPYGLSVPYDRPLKAIYVKKALKMMEELKELLNNENE